MGLELSHKFTLGLAAAIGIAVTVVEGSMMTFIYKLELAGHLSSAQISILDAGIVGILISMIT